MGRRGAGLPNPPQDSRVSCRGEAPRARMQESRVSRRGEPLGALSEPVARQQC